MSADTFEAPNNECFVWSIRKFSGIPFEKFSLYEDYFDTTLENPDEVYLRRDSEGDEIYTYIKAHEQDGVSFYYFILLIFFI